MTSDRPYRNLRRALRVLAAVPIVAGLAGLLFGSNAIPLAGEPTASVESELRFYSVWWLGAGLFLGWLAPRVHERARELRVFCAVLFLAGVGRVLAILDSGWPAPGLIALMAAEFTVPVVLLAWHGLIRAPRGDGGDRKGAR